MSVGKASIPSIPFTVMSSQRPSSDSAVESSSGSADDSPERHVAVPVESADVDPGESADADPVESAPRGVPVLENGCPFTFRPATPKIPTKAMPPQPKWMPGHSKFLRNLRASSPAEEAAMQAMIAKYSWQNLADYIKLRGHRPRVESMTVADLAMYCIRHLKDHFKELFS